ncbi:MAG: hypothetical protein LBD55_04770 [Treponema sp.]|jgi:hypothetical protein|nr:hypothetical protein [Treponema sp.]
MRYGISKRRGRRGEALAWYDIDKKLPDKYHNSIGFVVIKVCRLIALVLIQQV